MDEKLKSVLKDRVYIYLEEHGIPKGSSVDSSKLTMSLLADMPNELSLKLVQENGIKTLTDVVHEGIIESFNEFAVIDIDMFKNDGKLEPKLVADYLMKFWNFKTTRDNETIYFYDGGIYKDLGEIVIKENTQRLIENECKNHVINEVIGHVQRSTYTTRSVVDKNIVCMLNGVYNIDNDVLEPHNPNLFVTNQIPVVYDPEADCPNIRKFIGEIIEDKYVPTIQELFGYCLYRDYSIAKAFVFVGDGMNGKTTLMRLFERFIGKDNKSSVSMQDFDRDLFAMNSLYNKMINIYDDMPSNALKFTGKFKQVSGNSPLEAPVKFKDPIRFTNYAKLIFSCNQLPRTEDTSIAFWRRVFPINFPNTFDKDSADPKLFEKISSEEEISGLFNWAIEGLKRLLSQGHFTNEMTIEEIEDMWERMSTPVAGFVKDMLVIDPEGFVSKSDMYEGFIKYCKVFELPTLSKKKLGQELPRYAEIIRDAWTTDASGKSVRGWTGYKMESIDGVEVKEKTSNDLKVFTDE